MLMEIAALYFYYCWAATVNLLFLYKMFLYKTFLLTHTLICVYLAQKNHVGTFLHLNSPSFLTQYFYAFITALSESKNTLPVPIRQETFLFTLLFSRLKFNLLLSITITLKRMLSKLLCVNKVLESGPKGKLGCNGYMHKIDTLPYT